MTDDDKFFERLRGDARALRYEPDEIVLARIRARIQDRLEGRTGVAAILAAWFRPLAAMLTVVAIAAGIGLTRVEVDTASSLEQPPLEITMGGDSYRVGD